MRTGARLRQLTLIAAATTLTSAAAALARATTPAAPEPEKTSFFHIIWEGAEKPGAVIAAMSLVSLTIIIQHFYTIRRSTMTPNGEIETTRQMVEKRQFKEMLEYLKDRPSMFADVLTMSLRHGRHGFDAMHEAAQERAGAWSARLFRRVEYLNIIGNLGPLMGLLGTVLGMIRAFSEMQAAHGAYKPENLAGGIGLALVNTFLGLVVAIVSLGFFGVCRNRVDAMTVAAHAAVLDILEYFRPAPTTPQPAAAMAGAPTMVVQTTVNTAPSAPPASPRPTGPGATPTAGAMSPTGVPTPATGP